MRTLRFRWRRSDACKRAQRARRWFRSRAWTNCWKRTWENLRRAPTEAFAALDEEVASGWSGAVFVDPVVSLALGAGERLARLEEMVFAGQVSPDIIEAVLVWDAGEGRFENQRRLQRWSAVNGTPELPEAREFPGWASRLLSHCPTPENRVAWAHVLTGARGAQLEVLVEALRQSVETSPDVASVALRAMALDGARGELERLAAARTDLRRLVRRVGIVGDPFYCGWLLKQMSMKLARVAGESFSLITGVDLALRDLDVGPRTTSRPAPTTTRTIRTSTWTRTTACRGRIRRRSPRGGRRMNAVSPPARATSWASRRARRIACGC